MEQLNLKVGDRLREIRKRRNMTLDDVADVTGVSKPMLGQIERGQSVPTVTTLWKIATDSRTPFSCLPGGAAGGIRRRGFSGEAAYPGGEWNDAGLSLVCL